MSTEILIIDPSHKTADPSYVIYILVIKRSTQVMSSEILIIDPSRKTADPGHVIKT